MALEADCVICGNLTWIDRRVLGCTVFCDDCAEDQKLIEWYWEQRYKRAANQGGGR